MTATPGLLGEPSATALAETFKVLGDVTRVRILDAISRSEMCVCDIAGIVGLSESAVSHQLRLLRGMRLVRPRREGRMVFYTLDDQHIVGLFEQGLEHVEERAPAAMPSREAKASSSARVGGAAFAASPLRRATPKVAGLQGERRREAPAPVKKAPAAMSSREAKASSSARPSRGA